MSQFIRHLMIIFLIYRKTDNNELQIFELVRTGTHSDLFKK